MVPGAIHQPSVKLGGGNAQSYIQHMPDGPSGPKRFIVARTAAKSKAVKMPKGMKKPSAALALPNNDEGLSLEEKNGKVS